MARKSEVLAFILVGMMLGRMISWQGSLSPSLLVDWRTRNTTKKSRVPPAAFTSESDARTSLTSFAALPTTTTSTGDGSPFQFKSDPRKKESKDGVVKKKKRPRKGSGYKSTGGRIPESVPDPLEWGPHATKLNCLPRDSNSQHPLVSWQHQAPAAILLGVMKGGTRALMQYLRQHPQVVWLDRSRVQIVEAHYMDRSLVQTEFGIPQQENQIRYAKHFQHYYSGLFADKNRTIAKPDKIAIDDTPYLLAGGQRMVQAILCVAPWTKWMAILRDPIARIDSQYRYMNQGRMTRNEPMVDWETWVEHDIQLLTDTGVLQDWSQVDFEQYSGSKQEAEAWLRYVMRADGSMLLVGKSMYAVQLDIYFQAMDEAGKPREDLLIIQSEQMRSQTQEVFDRAVRHLGLAPHTLNNANEMHVTQTEVAIPMPEHVRERLRQLFEPYNRRLYKMLGWDHVWDQ